jgi:hypothetical protein
MQQNLESVQIKPEAITPPQTQPAMVVAAFKEIHRILKPSGMAYIGGDPG